MPNSATHAIRRQQCSQHCALSTPLHHTVSILSSPDASCDRDSDLDLSSGSFFIDSLVPRSFQARLASSSSNGDFTWRPLETAQTTARLRSSLIQKAARTGDRRSSRSPTDRIGRGEIPATEKTVDEEIRLARQSPALEHASLSLLSEREGAYFDAENGARGRKECRLESVLIEALNAVCNTLSREVVSFSFFPWVIFMVSCGYDYLVEDYTCLGQEDDRGEYP